MASYIHAPTAAGPSRLCTVFGVWTKKSNDSPASSDAVEVVARVETPPKYSLPAHPPAAYSLSPDSGNALDAFFGAGALEAHRPSSRATISAPPPYNRYSCEVTEKQSGVYPVQEPPTLARMLFKYGFLFFPFWLAGIYILFSPLRPTPDWEAGKTEVEKAQELHILRKIETKWARRCLYAMMSLAIAVLLLVVVIKFGIMADF